jgi:hypothetical protein
MRAALGRPRALVEPPRIAARAPPLPDVERLTRDAIVAAELGHREGSRVVTPQHGDTLFHRTALLERHRSNPPFRAATMTCQECFRSIVSGISPVCTAAAPHPDTLPVREDERGEGALTGTLLLRA